MVMVRDPCTVSQIKCIQSACCRLAKTDYQGQQARTNSRYAHCHRCSILATESGMLRSVSLQYLSTGLAHLAYILSHVSHCLVQHPAGVLQLTNCKNH